MSSPSSINVATCALRFFFTHTLPRKWPIFELVRVKIPERLPVVLAPAETRAVLGVIREPVHRMALTTIYGLGLRLTEGVTLKVDQIDSARRMVWVRDGKRARDRGIPLPQPLLIRLHQRALIPILFQAAFESLSALCADPHWLGGQVGALAVLHTWTRTLEWHPHLHLLVPGGALAPDGQTWLRPPLRPKSFLVPVRALAKRFRG